MKFGEAGKLRSVKSVWLAFREALRCAIEFYPETDGAGSFREELRDAEFVTFYNVNRLTVLCWALMLGKVLFRWFAFLAATMQLFI